MKATLMTICISFLLALPAFGKSTLDESRAGALTMPVNMSVAPGFSIGESLAKGRNIVNHVSISMLSGRADVLSGIDIGGLSNHYSGHVTGFQCAGIATSAGDNNAGAQWSGIINAGGHGFSGFQATGIVNFAGDRFRGAQWAGIMNRAQGSSDGSQLAGIFNTAYGKVRGMQLAGIANAADHLDAGIQVSGVCNVARTAAGKSLQLGLINVSDHNDGIPVGLVSYVRETGLRYDLWADETQFLNIGLRTGTRTWYSVLLAGAHMDSSSRWSLGWGFGRHTEIGASNYFDVDASVRHLNEDGWTDGKNLLSTVRFIGGWHVTDTVSLFGGPTVNFLASEVNDGSDLTSWSMKERTVGNRHERWWPGFVFGVKVFR